MFLSPLDPSISVAPLDVPDSELCTKTPEEFRAWVNRALEWIRDSYNNMMRGPTPMPAGPAGETYRELLDKFRKAKYENAKNTARSRLKRLISKVATKRDKTPTQVWPQLSNEDAGPLFELIVRNYVGYGGKLEPGLVPPPGSHAPGASVPPKKKKKAPNDAKRDWHQVDPDIDPVGWVHFSLWVSTFGHLEWGSPSWPLFPPYRAWRVGRTPGEDEWPPTRPAPPAEGGSAFPQYPINSPRVPIEPRDSFWDRLSEAYWYDFLSCNRRQPGAGPPSEAVQRFARERTGYSAEEYKRRKLAGDSSTRWGGDSGGTRNGTSTPGTPVPGSGGGGRAPRSPEGPDDSGFRDDRPPLPPQESGDGAERPPSAPTYEATTMLGNGLEIGPELGATGDTWGDPEPALG